MAFESAINNALVSKPLLDVHGLGIAERVIERPDLSDFRNAHLAELPVVSKRAHLAHANRNLNRV